MSTSASASALTLEPDWARKTVEVEPALSPVYDVLRDTREATKAPEGSLETYKIEYEKLVIAAGCYSASFGIPGVGLARRYHWTNSRC